MTLDAEIITVGEMSSTSMENCFGYAGEDSHELSMVFSFHHLKVDFMGNEKWVLVPTDFQKLNGQESCLECSVLVQSRSAASGFQIW